MYVPKESPPPPVQLPKVKTPESPKRRRRTQQHTTEVPLEPTPHQRVTRKAKVNMTPGRAKRQTPQAEPHTIPYETEVRP